jgi:hypothetical protein
MNEQIRQNHVLILLNEQDVELNSNFKYLIKFIILNRIFTSNWSIPIEAARIINGYIGNTKRSSYNYLF